MSDLPNGTVTFLFTDIEGSSKLWEEQPQTMRLALAHHDALLRAAIETNGGVVFKTIGDAFCAAFHTAPQALEAALSAQQRLHQVKAGVGSELMLNVRMALHSGTADLRDGDYFGQPLNRVARLLAAGHGGQVVLSDVVHELCRDNLPPEVFLKNLGEHHLRDLARPEQVYQLLHPDLIGEFPPLKSLNNPNLPNNLPQQLTSFIGREKEIVSVKSLLSQARLLTLTGSGGCGKTRLALQVAADVLEEYHDGVWLVELAALTNPALVPQTVAQVLRVKEQAGQSIQQTLIDYFKAKTILLMLDNCEHLLAACAQITDVLLRNCPHIKILASSREGLGIAGEQNFRVPSLSLPDTKQPSNPESLLQYEAVCLFIDRAILANSNFGVTNQNAPALASLCHRLDGIPLAIELAAARVRSLSIEDINNRLDNRFRLLTGGSRTSLPRQQTLRALIDWSYDLLKEQEKNLFQRLSVFAAGWTLEAAESVCAGAGIEEREVLDLLVSLIDKSLVLYTEREGKVRYHLLETVRQYSAEKLIEGGEVDRVRRRYRDFFLQWAERIGTWRTLPPDAHRMESEHDNLRNALEFCLEAEDGAEMGLRLLNSLFLFWYQCGHIQGVHERFAKALAHPHVSHSPAWWDARILSSLWRPSPEERRFLEENCLPAYRQAGDKVGEIVALNHLASQYAAIGNWEVQLACIEKGLSLCREMDHRPWLPAFTMDRGHIAFRQGDYVAALALYEEAHALDLERGHHYGEARVCIGHTAFRLGRMDYAESVCRECVRLYAAHSKTHFPQAVVGLSRIAAAQGQLERAARLLGVEARLLKEIGFPWLTNERNEYNRRVAQERSGLGEEAFTNAWEQGRAMSWEQAVAYALEEAPP